MIGTRPVPCLAPLDYRYALDAAVTLFAGAGAPLVSGPLEPLRAEAQQRFPPALPAGGLAALWIEPAAPTWRSDLAALGEQLAVGGTLVVIASRPLARLIPERRGWGGDPLGLQPRGVARLLHALGRAGFRVTRNDGIHSLKAMVFSQLGQSCDRVGRPDLGDRLRVAAREAYHVGGVLAPLSTVALLAARKERS